MEEATEPFDANKILLCEDRTGSRTSWRLTSLLREMQDALRSRFTTTGDEAVRSFEGAAEELVERGLDADAIVRYGMLGDVLGPALGVLLIDYILPPSANSDTSETGVDIDGWRALLRIPAVAPKRDDELTALVKETAQKVAPRLLAWAGHAELRKLISLEVPGEDEFWSGDLPQPTYSPVVVHYRWLVERLSETYLKSWSMSSLLLEYRYRNDLQPMTFPAWVMAERIVSYAELTDEIARRTALDWEPTPSEPRTEFMLAQMSDRARHLLAEGRATEAAALFEFAVQQWPDDTPSRNNLGFCLIPVDPARALGHLRKAARQGYAPAGINVHNRMCCHLALHRPRAALELAAQWWSSRVPAEDGCRGTLWKPSNEGWRLENHVAVAPAVIELAVQAARTQGWHDEEHAWQARSADLGCAMEDR
ncbi:hypothetical protein [Nonomuraea wenchangensis]|uniref:Tetratricopeptide repeat-containing protein n=1 Tax=Nonomuraea wenchangensis TaxID=568860 RepID=A0A1I0FPS8_9ACTN|nr:hypothetical protein [Nonomuraea wenchangensis]SET59585.1 hypothetical protein SAMN05421811_103538 [Nonomuraea wenchangensis]